MKPQQYVKVAVHGVPRSGTSWIGEILNSSPNTIYRFQPIFSYALKNYLTTASTKEDIASFFENLHVTDDAFINQTENRNSGSLPKFVKHKATHVIYKEVRYINILPNLMRKSPDVQLCAVIRNPLSVINSWLKAPREFRKDLGWSEIEEWRYALKKNLNKPEEFNGYEKWKEATLLFLYLKKQYPDRVHVLEYAKFLTNLIEETKFLFSSLGIPLTKETTNFLRQSSTKKDEKPYSVFRSQQTNDRWKVELDPRIVKEIQSDLKGTALEKYVGD